MNNQNQSAQEQRTHHNVPVEEVTVIVPDHPRQHGVPKTLLQINLADPSGKHLGGLMLIPTPTQKGGRDE